MRGAATTHLAVHLPRSALQPAGRGFESLSAHSVQVTSDQVDPEGPTRTMGLAISHGRS